MIAMYNGIWVNDKKHGHGTYTWPDGTNYAGPWVDDQQVGTGVLTFANSKGNY